MAQPARDRHAAAGIRALSERGPATAQRHALGSRSSCSATSRFKVRRSTSFLTANYTYLNDRLAQHYGLPAVGKTEFTRVDLSGNAQRGGLLTQGGFLSLTSHVNRTSPVVRGKWVLDNLLCATVPPPPANVNLAAVAMAKEQGLTQRQALAQHRADPSCNSCHQLMDPIGLGLENFNAIGAYRDMDAGKPIEFDGPAAVGQSVRRREGAGSADRRQAGVRALRRVQAIQLRARPRPSKPPATSMVPRSTTWSTRSPRTISPSAS